MSHSLHFDGSSLSQGRRAGPGPSSGAALLSDPQGQVTEHSIFLPRADPNEAEYWGLICGLLAAKDFGVSALCIYGDSRNVIDQVLERKPLHHARLLLLKIHAQELLKSFGPYTMEWIPRRKNTAADAAARACLLRRRGSFSSQGVKSDAIC